MLWPVYVEAYILKSVFWQLRLLGIQVLSQLSVACRLKMVSTNHCRHISFTYIIIAMYFSYRVFMHTGCH